MEIENFWPSKAIPIDLVSHMENKLKTLPHFNELGCNHISNSLSFDQEKIDFLKKFKDVLIFGIGGSSLGGQTIYQLRSTDTPQLHFIDNIDTRTFNKILRTLNPETTGVLSISKSGNTSETLFQTFLTQQVFKNSLKDKWTDHFAVLTEPKISALKLFAEKYGITTINHHTGVGGRFCIFTSVGAVIAHLCGFDFSMFRKGAYDLVSKSIKDLLQGSVHIVDLYKHHHVNQSVMFSYADALESYSEWYAQLWGESLGKRKEDQHLGITPVRALGTVDQHSQLQLYLDGPRDKLISIVSVLKQEASDCVEDPGITHPAINALIGKRMDSLFVAFQKGTQDTLIKKGCHVRSFVLEDLTPYELGQLMIYQVFETVATAYLLDVDPFDQPAVEESKQMAMSYLKDL